MPPGGEEPTRVPAGPERRGVPQVLPAEADVPQRVIVHGGQRMENAAVLARAEGPRRDGTSRGEGRADPSGQGREGAFGRRAAGRFEHQQHDGTLDRTDHHGRP